MNIQEKLKQRKANRSMGGKQSAFLNAMALKKAVI